VTFSLLALPLARPYLPSLFVQQNYRLVKEKYALTHPKEIMSQISSLYQENKQQLQSQQQPLLGEPKQLFLEIDDDSDGSNSSTAS
jgi:hypothetical protein